MSTLKSAEEWEREQFEMIPDNCPPGLFAQMARAIQADALRHAAELVKNTPRPFFRDAAVERIETEAKKLEAKA
jgi:hypothetical protein